MPEKERHNKQQQNKQEQQSDCSEMYKWKHVLPVANFHSLSKNPSNRNLGGKPRDEAITLV